MPRRRCRRICSSPGTCWDSNTTGSTRSSTLRRSEPQPGRKHAFKPSGQRKNDQSAVARIVYGRAAQVHRKGFAMIGHRLRTAVLIGLFAAAIGSWRAAGAETLALVGGSVYAAPDAEPLTGAV